MDSSSDILLPLFLKLAGRVVVLVGAGPVATSKAGPLAEAGALVRVVAPTVTAELERMALERGWEIRRREFTPEDLDGAWLAISAAPAVVNRAVSAEAELRRLFVVAVDDPPSASAYGAGIVRRGGVTVAISTAGQAPALAGLLREGIDALLPPELADWVDEARGLRPGWRSERLPLAERRPRLLAALNQIYAPASSTLPADPGDDGPAAAGRVPRGRVTLVGAGPGAADLLTVRGLRRLGEADLVLYDALSSEAEMRGYAPGAHWFYVGKRACRQSIGQDALNRLMIREASRGLHVVRLKCGDPFVFGRGGEEVLALAEAGIPCEVVPGVSASVAGPLLAGIPVTHRGAASAFTVVAGHHEATFRPLLAGLPSRGMTLVILMGLRQRRAISEALHEFGWPAEAPCAIVLGAATPQSWSWRGVLADLAEVTLPARGDDELAAPGLLVIGEVVSIADQIDRLRAAAELSEVSLPG